MAEEILVDTGPIVALLNRRDVHHQACSDLSQELPKPLLSTWAVLAESAWLLRDAPRGIERVMALVVAGIIECPVLDASSAAAISAYAQQYASLRPQLADLSLLHLADRRGVQKIFTLDRRDFLVYRTAVGTSLELVGPEAG